LADIGKVKDHCKVCTGMLQYLDALFEDTLHDRCRILVGSPIYMPKVT